MANVMFINTLGRDLYLHGRIGSIGQDPDSRGTSNTVIKHDDGPVEISVGDGDIFYCYGNQMVSDAENPELCRAAGGSTVTLDGTGPCYVNN